jgi:hypothetical protein
MKHLELTKEELELIKSKRIKEAQAKISKEQKKTEHNKAQAKKDQQEDIITSKKVAENSLSVMLDFESKLTAFKDNPFKKVITEHTDEIKASYYSFTCKKYADTITKLNSTKEGKKVLEQFQNNEIRRWDIENEKIRDLIYIIDYGVEIKLKPLTYSYKRCKYVTNTKVKCKTSKWNEVTEKYETKNVKRPCYTLYYAEKTHSRRTIQGVSVQKADSNNLGYSFYKGNSNYYKEVYRTAKRIVEEVNYQLSNLDQRIESQNKAERDHKYTQQKFAEYVSEHKALILKSDPQRLEITLKNKVRYNLNGSLCSDEKQEFVLSYDNINLPSRYDLNYETSEAMAIEFLDLISKFDFTQK